ncbi:MAG TPA: sugar ABC transporter substrate-binding protein, partial [Isosphaeraceae bacterium]|nr:sugar ABC transporter substrate-binding protein [Isosphaeraceae bacterium]
MVRHALPRWLLFSGLLLLAAGCDAQPEGGFTIEKAQEQLPKKTRRMRIGVVLPMYSHPFFVAQKKGIEKKAEELDVLVEVRDGQDNDRTQIAQVEALLNIGVDALVLCPRDEEALVPAVASANRARVPVVALNRRVKGGRLVCYVGADDVEGGQAQGQALVEALGPQGGNILYLQGTQGSSPQRQRAEGFRKVLAEHPEITIADERFADFQEDKAKAVMTNLVRRFRPGKIQAIVAQSDEMALPASEVCRAEGWKDVIVIGFDGTRAAFDAIKAGTLHATVLQSAARQGAEALEVTVESLKGKY